MIPCPMCSGSYGAHQFGCILYAQAAPAPSSQGLFYGSATYASKTPPQGVYDPRCAECQGKRGDCKCPDAPATATNPSHYTRMDPQPIDVIAAWGLNFNLGNVIKYVARAGHKSGAAFGDDLAKAADYLAREIARTSPDRSTK